MAGEWHGRGMLCVNRPFCILEDGTTVKCPTVKQKDGLYRENLKLLASSEVHSVVQMRIPLFSDMRSCI